MVSGNDSGPSSLTDCADGLCCILTIPCQAVTNGNLNLASQTPPVVMHNNFDWKDVNRYLFL